MKNEELPASSWFRRVFPTLTPIVKFLFIAICVLVLLVVIAAVAMNIHGSARLRDARAAAADAGVGLTSQAFDAKYGSPLDSRNAALYYEAAFNVQRVVGYKDIDALARSLSDIDVLAEPLPADILDAIRSTIAKHEEEISLIHAGSLLPRSRYEIDMASVRPLLPHLGRARMSGRLLAQAALLAAHDGDAAAGVARVHDGLALSRSLAREPFLVSNLIGMAITTITVSDGLRPVLSWTDIPADELAALQQEFQDYADNFSSRPCLEGEALFACKTYDWVITGKGKIDNIGEAFGDKADFFSFLLAIPRWLKAGYLKADEAATIRLYLQLITAEADCRTVAEVKSFDSHVQEELVASPYILTKILMPALGRALMQGLRHRARLRAAVAGIATLRFYNDRGEWPNSLDALVPEYLDAVPIDPATSAPLVYRRAEDGIMIYSVGENGVDDGGAPGLVPHAPSGSEGADDYAGIRIVRTAPHTGGETAQ